MVETAPSVDELIQHTDWLTQLARALVGEAYADDVVQETHAVALIRPPKPHTACAITNAEVDLANGRSGSALQFRTSHRLPAVQARGWTASALGRARVAQTQVDR